MSRVGFSLNTLRISSRSEARAPRPPPEAAETSPKSSIRRYRWPHCTLLTTRQSSPHPSPLLEMLLLRLEPVEEEPVDPEGLLVLTAGSTGLLMVQGGFGGRHTTSPWKPMMWSDPRADGLPTPPMGTLRPRCFFRMPSEMFCTVSAALVTRSFLSTSWPVSEMSTACVAAMRRDSGQGIPDSLQSKLCGSPVSKKFMNSLGSTSSRRIKTREPCPKTEAMG
mmetsp:Transcript_92552/g.224634  ORF Transcript_92552/g.224634 Transcript_92552/m.224634 type:complete len:222 (+) Transcript_92552:102-767(+)